VSDSKSYSSLTGSVLVPVDLTEGSKAALISGAEIAGMSGVPLIVLHVVHDSLENPGFYRRQSEGDAAWPNSDLAERMAADLVEECRAEYLDFLSCRALTQADRAKVDRFRSGSGGLTEIDLFPRGC